MYFSQSVNFSHQKLPNDFSDRLRLEPVPNKRLLLPSWPTPTLVLQIFGWQPCQLGIGLSRKYERTVSVRAQVDLNVHQVSSSPSTEPQKQFWNNHEGLVLLPHCFQQQNVEF